MNTRCPECGQSLRKYKSNPRTGTLEYEFIPCACDKGDKVKDIKKDRNDKKSKSPTTKKSNSGRRRG